MVYLNNSGSDKEEKKEKEEKVVWMAMGPERSSSSSSKPLHNFTMPCGLRWGNQRFLRCMKVNSNGEISAVERRPSSLSAFSNADANNTDSNASDTFVSIMTGKRKEREKFKDPHPPDSGLRRGSDYKKLGFNFKLPPSPQPPSSSATEPCRKFRLSETGGGGEQGDGDGIAAVREKLMFDLQTAADKMKDAILREGLETVDQDNPPSPAPAVAQTAAAVTVAPSESGDGAVRPWNLRTRRAACKGQPTANGFVFGSAGGAGTSGAVAASAPSTVKTLKVDVMKPKSSLSPLRAENNKSPRLRSGVAAVPTSITEMKERAKFSVGLSRREIEEDFIAIANRRPPRRPQKRPKYIQKQLDTLFPGLWLTEITADMYKVPETQ